MAIVTVSSTSPWKQIKHLYNGCRHGY